MIGSVDAVLTGWATREPSMSEDARANDWVDAIRGELAVIELGDGPPKRLNGSYRRDVVVGTGMS